MGIEPGRLQFSWVSSAESTKFVDVVKAVTDAIKTLGPNQNFIKQQAKKVA
jgi:coenzyme F420-reducing hydrogenase delta subunit